jgi:hypothetical protein
MDRGRVDATPAEKLMWGTYGKGGVEHCAGTCPRHRLRVKRLADCDTEHLQMILKNQRQVYFNGYAEAIHEILIKRGVQPEEFSLQAEAEMTDAAFAALARASRLN